MGEDGTDEQVGRVLSRREVLALLGSTGIGLLAGCSPRGRLIDEAQPNGAGAGSGGAGNAGPGGTPAQAAPGGTAGAGSAGGAAVGESRTAATSQTVPMPACVVRPEQTAGPYFVDLDLERSDIRLDPVDGSVSDGQPLNLGFRVATVDGGVCRPLQGAQVDVWHCDALGRYSGVTDPRSNAAESKFLRGFQVTDAAGEAHFTTVYPGWYQGRAVHIHFKIRHRGDAGAVHEFTSQLYFDDALNDRVLAQEPYRTQAGRRVRNADDALYRSGGAQLTLVVGETAGGYSALFDIGLLLT